jgi:hypothetical protein
MPSTILQLDPPMHVVTPLGEATAYLVIDYGAVENTIWVCDLHATRACKHFTSEQIRFFGNSTWGLDHPQTPESDP